VHERCPVCDKVFNKVFPQGIPNHYKKHIAAYKKHIAADVSADAAKAALDAFTAKAALDAFTAHVAKKREDKRRAAVEEKRRREAARQASARQAALELRRRREAEGVTERSQQPRVEHDREVAGDGLEAFPTYDYPETQWDGVATERYQAHMDDIAKSLREDGVLVLNTAGWRRGIPFNRGSRRVSEELQTALGALNAENRFPNLPECVRLEGKKHVTWPRNVAKANVTVRDRGVDYGIARAMDALDTVARDTLHNVCRSLGFRSTELDALLDESPLPLEEKGASTLTVFAYDAARDSLPSLTEFAAEPHVDRTILTLVVSNERDGLRVRRADDSWRTASLGRNRIAVIPGCTLEHALGGAISATTHAVSRLRVPRNTLVFRLAARPDAVVSPATPRDIAARYPTQTAKELDEAFERTHRSVNRPPEPANPAPRAARATPAIGREIHLKVKDLTNYVLRIKTTLDCQFLKIFEAFCDDRRHAHDTVRFLFKSSQIHSRQTPRDLDMEDGDRIDAMMEQVGD
jgi:small ubiquitin-related modifier